MSGPSFSRKEVRQLADWMVAEHGWQYEGDDAKGHSIWRYPPTGATHKLPCTPRGFNVRAERRKVAALMGVDLGGHRKSKRSAKPLTSGYSNRGAAKELRQWHESGPGAEADRLRAERADAIEALHNLARDGGPRAHMSRMCDLLREVSEAEDALRDLYQPVTPFDPNDLTQYA